MRYIVGSVGPPSVVEFHNYKKRFYCVFLRGRGLLYRIIWGRFARGGGVTKATLRAQFLGKKNRYSEHVISRDQHIRRGWGGTAFAHNIRVAKLVT